jgi:hypothetical protein
LQIKKSLREENDLNPMTAIANCLVRFSRTWNRKGKPTWVIANCIEETRDDFLRRSRKQEKVWVV